MSLKDILVHVGISRHRGQSIDVAIRLAQTFDGHLSALYTMPNVYIPSYVDGQLTTEIIAAQREDFAEQRGKVRRDFEERARKHGVKAEWREAEGEAPATAALHARHADLTVVGQLDPDESLPAAELALPERVLLESGRPVLMVPYAGEFVAIGQRVLVAWNASTQAARAVNDALPLLKRAKSVTILSVNPRHGNKGHGEIPGADIALHLARHGVKAEATHIHADDIAIGDMILSRAADCGADLIVMGAYGHARLREIVLGGATRNLLEHMTAPVLMSH
jgi:nucleotide-binding universal stress UspA family protein